MMSIMPRAVLMKMSKEGVDAYHKKLEDEAKNSVTPDEAADLDAFGADDDEKVDNPNELK